MGPHGRIFLSRGCERGSRCYELVISLLREGISLLRVGCLVVARGDLVVARGDLVIAR